MPIVSNILDALRRIGSPAEKSALRRQDEQLVGREILERGRVVARSGDEVASGFHATIAPFPEDVVRLDESGTDLINSNAKLAEALMEEFGIAPSAHPLDKLDRAFEEWVCGLDRHGYSAANVVEILGSSFGNYCNQTLGMHWVEVSDQYGVSLAVDGNEFEFRAYPYASIEKRIASAEHTFFRSVHTLLTHQKQNSRARGNAAQLFVQADL